MLAPGTALLELAVRAGDQAGCGVVEELTLATPLILPGPGAVHVQVWAGPPGESGRRPVTIRSRPDRADERSWTLHASGTLAPGSSLAEFDAVVWPPAGAVPVDLTGFYEQAAEAGFVYGPVFRGLRAAWRRGDEVLAEVALPDEAGSAGFAVHPALLDACLHAAGLAGQDDGWDRVPFTWRGVCVHAHGARAVRVRLAPAGRAPIRPHRFLALAVVELLCDLKTRFAVRNASRMPQQDRRPALSTPARHPSGSSRSNR